MYLYNKLYVCKLCLPVLRECFVWSGLCINRIYIYIYIYIWQHHPPHGPPENDDEGELPALSDDSSDSGTLTIVFNSHRSRNVQMVGATDATDASKSKVDLLLKECYLK